MRVPLALVAVPLLAGSAAGLHFYYLDQIAILSAGAAAVALLAGAGAWALDDSRVFVVSIVVGSLLSAVSLGASSAVAAYSPSLLTWFHRHRPSEPVALHGVLEEDAALGAFGVSLHAKVTRLVLDGVAFDVSGGARLGVAGSLAVARRRDWRAGRHVVMTATLREPAVYLNPGVPDEQKRLARRGVVLVGSVKSAALIDVTQPGTWLSELAARCRNWIRERLAHDVGRWNGRSGGVATAILLGDRTGLGEDDERRLQEAGTYHVIAISGGNIALLAAMMVVLLRILRLPHRPTAVITIVLLQAYGGIVVSGPSVERAITAATLYLAASAFDHRGSTLNVLATAAIAAVAISPLTTFDPGFLLSFGATLGILVGVPRMLAVLPGRRAVVRVALGVLAGTAAAEVVLAPIGAVLFSRITVAGFLLNFAAIPLMTVIQAGSLAVLMLSFHEPLAYGAGRLVHVAVEWLIASAEVVDIAPWLSRTVPPPAWWLLSAYYAAIATVVWLPRCRPAATIVSLLAAALIYLGGPLAASRMVPPLEPGAMRLVFVDVGQGDATLVLLPDRRAVLVDAGGFPIPALQHSESGQAARFDVGDRVVAPTLRAFGVRTLDALVLTHADPDHIGGAPAIVRMFRPRAIWEGVPVPPHEELNAIATAAIATGAEWRGVVGGDRLQLGAVHIRVLHPPIPDWERQRVRNEDSVVLEFRLGNVAVILPGDIGREGESAVLRHVSPAPLTVLKAPHHGSATSSTIAFLGALEPAAVIFSAGRANRFGHPAAPVVERYREIGAEIFSTAEDGAVIVDSDGTQVKIQSWSGRKVTITPQPGGRGVIVHPERRHDTGRLLTGS